MSSLRVSVLWSDVDHDAGVIRIRRQADRKGQLVEPKTPQAKRDVVLAPTLAKMLRLHRMASRYKTDDDLVFASATGRPMNGRNVSRRGLDKALANAALGKIRFHDSRHTYASMLVSEGLNVVFVSRQMGHASPDTTCADLQPLVGRGRALEQGKRGPGRRLHGVELTFRVDIGA